MWLWAGYAFGVVAGLRHALEPDHVAAVSTVVVEQRSPFASMRFASLWGIGHAFVLLVVGGALFVLRAEMPDRIASLFELAVALMLIGLGIRSLRAASRYGRSGSAVTHSHGGTVHAHGASEAHVHVSKWTLATRPLLIGSMHGLAGSGALTALVAASYPSAIGGVLFMAVYGLGATIGMALLAGVAGVPLARLMRTRRGPQALLAIAGGVSVLTGLVWAWPIVAG